MIFFFYYLSLLSMLNAQLAVITAHQLRILSLEPPNGNQILSYTLILFLYGLFYLACVYVRLAIQWNNRIIISYLAECNESIIYCSFFLNVTMYQRLSYILIKKQMIVHFSFIRSFVIEQNSRSHFFFV